MLMTQRGSVFVGASEDRDAELSAVGTLLAERSAIAGPNDSASLAEDELLQGLRSRRIGRTSMQVLTGKAGQ